jgi:hypothetical protein
MMTESPMRTSARQIALNVGLVPQFHGAKRGDEEVEHGRHSPSTNMRRHVLTIQLVSFVHRRLKLLKKN